MKIDIKPIKNKQQHSQFLKWVNEQFDKGVRKGTAEGDQLEIALLLIKNYEDENYPIPAPDAIEVIKMKMQERGMRNKDLVGLIGSKSYVSALLNKRKPLTLEIAKIFHRHFGVPASVFFS